MNDAFSHSYVNYAIRDSHVNDAIRRLLAASTLSKRQHSEISHVLTPDYSP